MTRRFFKKDDRVHGNEYFVVKVGHRYYGGEVAEYQEVKTVVRSEREYFPGWGGWFSRNGRAAMAKWRREIKTGKAANYRKIKPSEEVTTRKATGRSFSQLVDSMDDAKHYRKYAVALKVEERLQAEYKDLGITVKIEVYTKEGTQ